MKSIYHEGNIGVTTPGRRVLKGSLVLMPFVVREQKCLVSGLRGSVVGLELEPLSANVQPTAHLAAQVVCLPSCLWSSAGFGRYDIRNVDVYNSSNVFQEFYFTCLPSSLILSMIPVFYLSECFLCTH